MANRDYRGRCGQKLPEPCICFRPRGHDGFHECSCTIYAHPHPASLYDEAAR